MATNNALNNITAASGKILQGQGIGVASNFSTATYPSTATTSGQLIRADGTNWSATTSTYPNTNAAGTLVYASSANTMAALTTANSRALFTNGSGVPAIGTIPIASGGTNANSFTQSNGIVTYNGTSLVNYAGPQLDSSGRYINTSQTSFFAYLTSAQNNVTGDATAYTIVCGSTLYNVGSNYNTGTGIFTAPKAGNYIFNCSVKFNGITTANFQVYCLVLCSTAGTSRGTRLSNLTDTNPSANLSVVVKLALNETVTFQCVAANTTKVVGVDPNSGSTYLTFFSGALLG